MKTCERTKPGWKCTREQGHDGPCAAIPVGIGHRLRWAWRLRWLRVLFWR